MDELAAFVAARLDEEEHVAKMAAEDASAGARWHVAARYPNSGSAGIEGENGEKIVSDEGFPSQMEAEHIGRHDPARVLRDVAAKRAIAALHKVNAEPEIWGDRLDAPEMRGKPTGGTNYWCAQCDHDRDYGHIGGAGEGCPTLRALASAWSDHPDYKPEWSA